MPTAAYTESFTLSMVKPVTGGSTYKFRVRADRFSGAAAADLAFYRVHTSAIYFPTAYGTVTTTKSPLAGSYDDSNDPSGLKAPPSEKQVITIAMHEQIVKQRVAEEREAMLARMALLEKRLSDLEN